jgi:hypothetical protein
MVLQSLTTLACALALVDCGGAAPMSAEPATPARRQAAPTSGTRAGAPAAGSSSEASPELVVGDVRLRIHPDTCTLTSIRATRERIHRLALAPPCRFAEAPDGRTRVVRTAAGDVVLAERSVPLGGPDCETSLQAVVVGESDVRLSCEIQRVTACSPYEWDDLLYHTLALDTTGCTRSARSPPPATPSGR